MQQPLIPQAPSQVPPDQQTPISPISPQNQLALLADNSTQHSLRTRKWKTYLITTSVFLLFEAVGIYVFVKALASGGADANSGGTLFGYLILTPVVIFGCILFVAKEILGEALFKNFAQVNGFDYQKDGVVGGAYGSLFRHSNNHIAGNLVSGTYASHRFRLFVAQQALGDGGSNHSKFKPIATQTVMVFEIPGKLPELILEAKANKITNIVKSSDLTHTISLEGDFNDYFTLYSPPDFEIEARQVFSPDTMALIEDISKHFSVEFVNNHIYLYYNRHISDEQTLIQMFVIADRLIKEIAPVSNEFADISTTALVPVSIPVVSKKSISSTKLALIISAAILGIMAINIIVHVAFS